MWGATSRLYGQCQRRSNFNPRAPCGARLYPQKYPHDAAADFNPRAPCGARRLPSVLLLARVMISIHAPRVGRDARQSVAQERARRFQSTRPVWGATAIFDAMQFPVLISIHAPRVGRDRSPRAGNPARLDFNPRAPCGARLQSGHGRRVKKIFQSTRPVWGATIFDVCNIRTKKISIHAPRVGRDLAAVLRLQLARNISIHAPRVGRDPASAAAHVRRRHFNPRAPCGARRRRARLGARGDAISIHAPRVGRDSKFDDFTPSNLHKRYKRVLARPKNTREKGKIKQKLAYIHAFSAFLGCEGSGTFCALVLRTQYR